jgi:hypothetical protein
MNRILAKQEELTQHNIYKTFNNLANIQHFMRFHVFAVWDFMSLLKSLQRHITCVSLPWTPSIYPAEMVRLVNQIVVGEESDVDQFGNPISHFELYLKAMEEIGASTAEMSDFLSTIDIQSIPAGAREFVEYNLNVAQNGHVVEVAASFFYGREKLIPEMFEVIVSTLKKENIHAPTLMYYLERHIEVDSGEHGPLAMKCLEHLVGDNEELQTLAVNAGIKALEMRKNLWDDVLNQLKTKIENKD